MNWRQPWLFALLIPLFLMGVAACDDSSDDDSNVNVSGTINYASHASGEIVVVVYPKGTDPGPDDIEGQTSVAGGTTVTYTVEVKGNQTVYVYAWNDEDGGGSPSGTEARACSGDTDLAGDDVAGVDVTLMDETGCPTAP